MRILVLHDELYPNTSANARIVYRIIDELLKHKDVDITILGCAQTEEQRALFYRGAKVIHKPWKIATRYLNLVRYLGKLKWLRYILMPRSIVYGVRYQHWEPRDIEMYRWIYRNRREFDIILACGMPFYTINIASKLSKFIPVVNYYMEPYWNNDSKEKQIARLWDESASRIITTGLISNLYAKNADDSIMKKIVQVEFPNMIEREQTITKSPLNEHDITLAFVGKFYPKVRDPQFLFDIMDKIHNNGINLSIAGGFNGSFPKIFVEKYFRNMISYIKYLGMLPPHQADQLLMQSDILVHIGNTRPDMLPSKILDYISTGKPIINLYQHDQCPTLTILEKYPLKINIRVGSTLTADLLQQIKDFCFNNRGIQIPFSEIESFYTQYTPKVVGDIFYETLYSVTNKK